MYAVQCYNFYQINQPYRHHFGVVPHLGNQHGVNSHQGSFDESDDTDQADPRSLNLATGKALLLSLQFVSLRRKTQNVPLFYKSV